MKKNKNIFLNNTIKNGMLFSIYSFINSCFSFVLLLILAKYINPAEYGQLNLFTIFTQVLTIFVCLGTQGYVAISFFRSEKDKYKSVLTFVFLISTLMFLIYSLALVVFPLLFERTLGLEIQYLFIAILVCYLQVFNKQCFEMMRINEYVEKYGILSVSQAFLNFVLSLLLVVSFQYGWVGRVYTTLILVVLYFFVSICYFLQHKLIKFEIPEKKICVETLKYGLPLLPHHTGVWVRQSFDRFVINSYHTSSLVGLYSFAGNFANILLMVGTAFNAVNSVQIYKELAKGYSEAKARLDKIVKYSSMAFGLLAVIIVLGCYVFIPIFFPNYDGFTRYLIPLTLSTYFQCIYLLNVNYLFFYKKTIVLMYITVSLSLIQLILSLLLTKYDVMFAALINMVINGFICLFVMVYKKSLCNEEELKEDVLK